jgi:hypothetical protein
MQRMAMYATVLELITWVSLDTQSVSDVTNEVSYPTLEPTIRGTRIRGVRGWHTLRVFNNSPSRDRFWDRFWDTFF